MDPAGGVKDDLERGARLDLNGTHIIRPVPCPTAPSARLPLIGTSRPGVVS
jgi:hypothetical protein